MSVRYALSACSLGLEHLVPGYRSFSVQARQWYDHQVTNRIPPAILYTVDKIIYYIEKLLPSLILVVGTALFGLRVQVDKSALNAGMLVMLLGALHHAIAYTFYPYEALEDLTSHHRQIASVVPDDQFLHVLITALENDKSVVVVGKPGTGKSVQVKEAFAGRMREKGQKVYELNYAVLMSDPARIYVRLLDLAKVLWRDQAILVVDESQLLTLRFQDISLADWIKLTVERKGIRMVCITTSHEYEKMQAADDGAFNRRYLKLSVEEMQSRSEGNKKETYQQIIRAHYGDRVSDEIAQYVIANASKHYDRGSPAAELDMLEGVVLYKKGCQDETPIVEDNFTKAIEQGFIPKVH